MPSTSAASLALAARLRDRSDASLARLIRDRGVGPAALRDVFDLAEALLEPHSVAPALANLSRRALAAIATAGDDSSTAWCARLAVVANSRAGFTCRACPRREPASTRCSACAL